VQPRPAPTNPASRSRHNARAKPGQRPAFRPDRGPPQQQQQPSQRAAPRKPKARVNGDIRAAQVRAVLPDGSNQVRSGWLHHKRGTWLQVMCGRQQEHTQNPVTSERLGA
jgi:hypothetical protein